MLVLQSIYINIPDLKYLMLSNMYQNEEAKLKTSAKFLNQMVLRLYLDSIV